MRLTDAHFRDIPGVDQLFDYDVRTDGQPVYLGQAPHGTAEGVLRWVLFKYTYDGSNFITKIESVGEGIWTIRDEYFS